MPWEQKSSCESCHTHNTWNSDQIITWFWIPPLFIINGLTPEASWITAVFLVYREKTSFSSLRKQAWLATGSLRFSKMLFSCKETIFIIIIIVKFSLEKLSIFNEFGKNSALSLKFVTAFEIILVIFTYCPFDRALFRFSPFHWGTLIPRADKFPRCGTTAHTRKCRRTAPDEQSFENGKQLCSWEMYNPNILSYGSSSDSTWGSSCCLPWGDILNHHCMTEEKKPGCLLHHPVQTN